MNERFKSGGRLLHTAADGTRSVPATFAIAMVIGCWSAIGTQALAVEKRFDFRASQFDNAGLKLLGVGTSRLVVPEADGLRVMIPQAARVDEIGFEPRVGLRGDFEIIATYEILKVDAPKSGYGVGPRIYITTATEDEQAATIARLKRVREGDVFSAHSARYVATEQDPRQREHVTNFARATAKTGRLCLKRMGKDLSWLADDAESGVFIEIRAAPFTDADVPSVRIALHRGGAKTAAEARWKEVVVRADEFIDMRDRSSGAGLLAMAGLLAVVVVAIGVWYYRRTR